MKNRKRKIIIGVGVCFTISVIITFIICMLFTPKIVLEEPDLTISVGEDYKEPGYRAYSNNQDITNQVRVTGKVNSKKLGTYIIAYEVNFFLFHTKKVRIVEVVDKEAPSLELVGDMEVFVCPNDTYQESGYRAIDNYDQDLTAKVLIEDSKEMIDSKKERIYEVVDSSGNKTIKKRIIHYEDLEKPNIILKGNALEYVEVNGSYQEFGYQAIDRCDGDITSKVIVHGKVDVSKEGSYMVSYEVTDASGNQEKVTRTIIVTKSFNSQKGTIYLTFDDGPSSTITGNVLDILKEEGVQATFFVIHHSDQLDYLIKREHEEGHTVGLHSYSHNYGFVYQSVANYFNDLDKIEVQVKNITGVDSKIIRFPGGSSNTISKKYQVGIMSDLTKEVVQRGYHYFDWNVASGDAGGVHSSEEVYQNVIAGLSPNRSNVVLMHDFENNYYTLNALRNIIQYGKENGYSFQKITMNTAMVTHKVAN